MATGPMRKPKKATDEMRERAKQLNDDTRVRIAVRITPEMRKTIKRVALEDDITLTEFLLQAIELRLQKAEASTSPSGQDS
ncbi:hypothetical protein [Corynebacterium aquilae]|uniref:Uncharacterized protein n=1 Tax=Corynebacterium aquilae DSM 44791 TaxID=1431546 RepID=A0A1L7CEH8_9CORY|nr:hypothetical protein [Corynebacterium aquilae]APT84251.1 hypothetical protein CAQU_03275 [Corynebacterium aquilae DSM 44791]